MKFYSVGDELFQADGRSDMTKLIAAFLNFPNGPKNLKIIFTFVPCILLLSKF